MEKLLTLFMYILWTVSIIGILIITFTSFRYIDLDVIIGILFLLTLINTFVTLKRK